MNWETRGSLYLVEPKTLRPLTYRRFADMARLQYVSIHAQPYEFSRCSRSLALIAHYLEAKTSRPLACFPPRCYESFCHRNIRVKIAEEFLVKGDRRDGTFARENPNPSGGPKIDASCQSQVPAGKTSNGALLDWRSTIGAVTARGIRLEDFRSHQLTRIQTVPLRWKGKLPLNSLASV